LKYEDEFFDLFKENLDVEEVKRTSLNQYRKVTMESLGLTGERKVAIVYASGAIVRGRSGNDPFGDSDVLASDSMSETLRDVAKDDKIEAVVLRIDSPGGDAIASDQMWREMNRLSEKKPVVISMSDVAASGGYYIAMAGAPVLAYPGTYTGSIGVVFGKVSLAGLYEKIGLNKEVLTRGRFAAIDTETRTMTDPERAKLRESIESLYKGFVQKVADSREKEWDEIHEVAQGRVWMGSQAVENGLVDELGGIDRAIAMAKEKAGIAEDESVNLIVYPAKKHWLQMILDQELNTGNSKLLRWIKTQIPDLPHWRAVMQGGMLAVAPYWVTVE
jgi:protease-4